VAVRRAARLELDDIPEYGCRRISRPILPEGPIALGFGDADVAVGRRACPRTEVWFTARGGAAVDIPRFYGLLGASALVGGSYALRPNLELFGTAELLRYQYGINATLGTDQLAIGQVTAGGTFVFFERGPYAMGASARLLLPTSTATMNVRTLGAEIGAPFTFRTGGLGGHSYAGIDFSAGLGAGPALPRFGVLLTAGVEYTPWRWFEVAADVTAHLGTHALLDYAAPSVAVRFALWRRLAAEVGLSLQLAGDRSFSLSPDLRLEAAAAARLSWRL
jgi:hypothetical protein